MLSTPPTELIPALKRLETNLAATEAISQPHQISSLRIHSRESLENLILILIQQAAESLNVKGTLSNAMLYECTQMIINDYWHLRPEEIMYCFRRGKTGAYGKDYNRLDTATIMGWLHEYDTGERLSILETERIRQQKQERQQAQQDAETIAQFVYPDAESLFLNQQRKQKKVEKQQLQQKENEFQRLQLDYYESRKTKQPLF